MDGWMILSVLSRWVHVISACLLIGGLFFLWRIAPRSWDDPAVDGRFKRTIHFVAALLILSGAFNAWRAWGMYSLAPGVLHGVFGLHGLIGVIVIVLVEIAASRRRGGLLTTALLLAVVAALAASSLKSMRERAMLRSVPAPTTAPLES